LVSFDVAKDKKGHFPMKSVGRLWQSGCWGKTAIGCGSFFVASVLMVIACSVFAVVIRVVNPELAAQIDATATARQFATATARAEQRVGLTATATAPTVTPEPTTPIVQTPTIEIIITSTPNMGDLQLGDRVETSDWALTITKVERASSLIWKDRPLVPEGQWIIISGEANNLTTTQVNLLNSSFKLRTPSLRGDITMHGDATGASAIAHNIPKSIAGWVGLELKAGETAPFIIAFDVPVVAKQVVLYVDDADATYNLGLVQEATEIIIPTVTPIPPTATTEPTTAPQPTASSVEVQTSPSPSMVAEGKVTKAANLRPLPSSTDDTGVIGRLHADTMVTLEGRTAASDWYLVRTTRGLYGWVSASLLSIDPAAVVNVPVVTNTDETVADWHYGGEVALVVWNVEQHEALSSFQRASAGNTYLLVGVSVGTVDRDSAPYNPLYFSLKDDSGFEYSPVIYTGERGLKSGELPRGETVSGYLAFEIPEDAKGLTLSYEPLVILGGYEEIRIPITE
jgi:hypothetical protein